MKTRSIVLAIAAVAFLLVIDHPLRADFPKPSLYPISWELTFDHARPKRFVIETPGESTPIAVWYITYHVANNTDRDKINFYPKFEMMTADGEIVRSDKNIPPAVFEAIKNREHLKYLQDANHIGGELRQGEDQSKDGVAIWIEPKQRMGTFDVFVSGFWGESAVVKEGDKDATVHKTLQLTYHVNGDNSAVTNDEDSQYIMR